jgi:filamentous hemagglutinin family protein
MRAAQSRPRVRDAVRQALFMGPAVVAALACPPVLANPEGGVVARGNATISGGSGTLNVHQTSQRAVINWRSFSIGQAETVNFQQPNANAATLNRVTGAQRSVIEGALNANGRVYLINPSGILFTRSARVDVGSLVATTANITNDNFMAERLEFSEPGAAGATIENLGTISVHDGGLAALVAPSVRNAGLIQANLGTVALGAGRTFTLDLYGDRLINFAVTEASSANEGAEPHTADNAGQLIADGGQVLMTAQAASDVVGGVVNMSGVIQARSVARDQTGRIILDGAHSTVDVSGQIDASGDEAGGTVYVGGPPAAASSGTRARTVAVHDGASIDASARTAGNGGTVSIWGTDSARFEGSIAATGGASSGDGGFVEVSSRGDLQFLGAADTTAQHGAAGVVLLDPEDITVGRSGSSSTSASLIDADALTRMLRNGTNVVLVADRSIRVEHIIDGRPLDGGTTPSGSVSMTAGTPLTPGTILINAPVITNNAPIGLTSTGDITITGQGLLYVANGTGAVGTSQITLNARGSLDVTGDLISLGTISLRARVDVALARALAGLDPGSGATGIGELVVVAEEGSVSIAGGLASGQVSIDAAQGVGLEGNSLIALGAISIDGGSGPVQVGAAGSTAGVAGLDGQSITLDTGGTVTLNQSLRTAGGDIRVGGQASTGAVTAADGALLDTGGTVGNVTVSSAGAVRLNGISAGGTIDVTGTAITNTRAALVAGTDSNVTLDARGGAVTLGAPSGPAVDSKGGDVTIRNAGLVSITGGLQSDGGNILLGSAAARLASLNASGILDTKGPAGNVTSGDVLIYTGGEVVTSGITAGRDVVIDGNGVRNGSRTIDAGRDVRLAAGAGPVTLAGVANEAAVVAGGIVEIRSAGAVALDGGITADSDVTIGTAGARVASVNMATGTAIQAGATAASTAGIEIYTSGNVTAGNLIVGQNGTVLVDARDAAGVVDTISLIAGLGGFTGSSGIGSLDVRSDGPVTLNGATVVGHVDLRGEGITNATASIVAGGPITLDGGSGPIRIGANGATASDAGLESTGTGGAVTINTSGAIQLDQGIRTAGGDIRIGNEAPTGQLTSANGALLDTRGAAGSVSVNSSGAVALSGISAGGTIDVSGSSITNSTAGLVAIGNVTLSAGSGGVTLNPVLDNLASPGPESGVASTGAGRILIETLGEVSIGSNISTAVGDVIVVGEQDGTDPDSDPDGRALGITASSDALIQSGGDVLLFASNGGVSLPSGAVAGPSTTDGVHIDARGDVAVGPITGAAVGNSAGPTGWVTIRAASIETNGILTAGRSLQTNDGVRLIVGPGGRVDILGPIEARGGPVQIGLAAPGTPGAPTNAQVNLSHNILTTGQDITINGDITLFRGHYSCDDEGNCGWEGIGRWDLGVKAGAATDLFTPFAGELDNTFVDAFFSEDGRLFGHNPQDLIDLSPSGCPECVVRFTNDGADYLVNEIRFNDFDTDPSTPDVQCPEGDACRQGNGSVTLFFVGTRDLFAVDMAGDPIEILNDQSGGRDPAAQACVDAWICGYRYDDDGVVAEANAVNRERRLRDFLGFLTLTVDTTRAAGSGAGANIVVNGNLSRFVPDGYADSLSADPKVYPSHVNHEFSVLLGETGTLVIAGRLGDTLEEARNTGSYDPTGGSVFGGLIDLGDPDVFLRDNHGVPRLGQFQLRIVGDSTDPVQADEAGGYLNSYFLNGVLATPEDSLDESTIPNVTFAPRVYVFGVPWTDRSRGRPAAGGGPPDLDFGGPVNIGNLPGTTGPGQGPPGRNGQSGNGGGAGPGTGGSSVDGNSGSGTGIGVPQEGSIGAGSEPVAEDDQRRNDAESDNEAGASDKDDPCRQGAAKLADLGRSPGMSGAEADAFSRCRSDF